MMPLELLQTILRSILRAAMSVIFYPTTFKTIPPQLPWSDHPSIQPQRRTLQSFANEIDRVFRYPCSMRRMLLMSGAMKKSYKESLLNSESSMLPSFCHALPTGQEKGSFIALDLGGSTFRVALVELQGRSAADQAMTVTHMTSTKIDESIRSLSGPKFFAWMAARIHEMLDETAEMRTPVELISIGFTWSFPIEQTSHRSGLMQDMGKGFACAQGTIGMDVADLLETACSRLGLKVRVNAILNDGSATLLSQAYLDPATSMGMITGTGINAAAYLPTAAIGRSKFGKRDESWFANADRVIVNTEVSMFGKGILPQSRWDELLNKSHILPDFQPLEYMTTGRYLGELMRLIVLDAIETCGLFGGRTSAILLEPYSLDTSILARLEEDRSSDMVDSSIMIEKSFGLSTQPSVDDLAFLRLVAQSISRRAAAYIAVAVHALWGLQKDTDINPHTPYGTPKTSIACNGSVILKYPGFKDRCESYIARMIAEGASAGTNFPKEKIALEPTYEAAIFGAAVAVAMADQG